MKERFKALPEVLQWQILSKFAGGAGFLLLFIVIVIFYHNVYLWLPSLFFMALLIVNGIFLLYNSLNGNYVSVAGVCENIEVTGIGKRVKSITLKLEENSLKISVRHKIKKLKLGDTVIVYTVIEEPKKELTYEERLNNAMMVLCPISKYSGKTLGEVLREDPKALKWVAEKFTGPEETKAAAQLICEYALQQASA